MALKFKPGDPLYERIKQQVLDAEYGDEQEVLDSIDRWLEDMRQRRLANEAIFAESPRLDETGSAEPAETGGDS